MEAEQKIVVVYVDELLLEHQREQLRKRMASEFPDMRIAIVDGGVRVALHSCEEFADQDDRDEPPPMHMMQKAYDCLDDKLKEEYGTFEQFVAKRNVLLAHEEKPFKL